MLEQICRKPIDLFSVERCWPLGNHGMRVQWSAAFDGTPMHIYGCIDTHRRESMQKAAEKEPNTRLWDETTGLLIHLPESDPKLPELAELRQPRLASKRLSSLGLGNIDSVTLQGYKPARRATLIYKTIDNRRYVGKIFKTTADAKQVAERHQILRDALSDTAGPKITVPRVVGVIESVGMVVFEAVPGRAPNPLKHSGDLEILMQALTALHQASIAGLETFGMAEEHEALDRWIRFAGSVDPSLADRASALTSQRLERGEQPVAITPSRLIHRDYYEKQLLVTKRKATLLDLDTLAYGPPEIDLGNLVAHITLARLLKMNAHGLQESITQTREHYPACDATALVYYTVTSLIRISLVHGMRDASKHAAHPLLDAAQHLIEGIEK